MQYRVLFAFLAGTGGGEDERGKSHRPRTRYGGDFNHQLYQFQLYTQGLGKWSLDRSVDQTLARDSLIIRPQRVTSLTEGHSDTSDYAY